MKISIVSTVYCSEIFIDEFVKLTLIALKKIKCKSYEIIFDNDGSPDQSIQKLIEKQMEKLMFDILKRF